MNINPRLVLLSALILSQPILNANAAGFQGADEATQANCQRYRENTTAAKQKELEKYVPKPANEYYSTGTCLDSILNTRVNIFTMPSLDGVLSGLMNAATNRACSAVMGGWNQAVGAANGTLGTSVNVPYVGNVSAGSVGTGYGAPITINGQPANTQVLQSQTTQAVSSNQSTFDRAKNKLLNVFR